MKYTVYALIVVLVLSMTAFAANANMNLISAGKVAGTNLNPGTYKLSWTGEGNNVQVNIVGKGVKLTVPATVVNLEKGAQHDAVMKSADGTVQEVQFGGKKFSLKFAGTADSNAGGK